MIIGNALGKLFDGFTIDVDSSTVKVKYDYGHQNALDLFIATMDKAGSEKLPLIFYVEDYSTEFDGWYTCETKIFILTETKTSYLSQYRTKETYVRYIVPIYEKIKKKIENEFFIQLLQEPRNQLPFIDVANLGENISRIGSKSSSRSVINAHVDSRIIDIKFRINTNCIN